jgi:DNA processing protein
MNKREQEIFDWLCLARTDGIGPISFFGLLAKFGDAKTAITQLPKILAKNGNQKYHIPAFSQIEAEIKATLEFGGRFFLANDDDFPIELGNINPPPPIISAVGNFSLLAKPKVAIVGARNASMVGMKMARELAGNLGKNGFVITSGLARGIDGAAHIASLHTGTIAVVAGGIDHIYPPEHSELYEKIKELGLIVSENRFSAQVFARDFPRRNRIISGLSKGVIVVEAEEKSGSLISARFANEQGREVMAVPGSPLDARAMGPNNLIKEGAALITNANDVLQILSSQLRLNTPRNPAFLQNSPLIIENGLKENILELLSPVPISLDEICMQTSLPWRTIAAIIVELELEGKAYMKMGNMVSNCQ